MANDLQGPLAQFIHDRRVRFTVSHEKVIGADGPVSVGFDVRLYAWHGFDAHDLQGCAVCAGLEKRLQELAEISVRTEDHPTEVEIVPEYSLLYDSRDAPGTDDVALDVRLLLRGEDDHPVGKAEEGYLKQVRARLKGLGVREC